MPVRLYSRKSAVETENRRLKNHAARKAAIPYTGMANQIITILMTEDSILFQNKKNCSPNPFNNPCSVVCA